jgi:hypothetical protein
MGILESLGPINTTLKLVSSIVNRGGRARAPKAAQPESPRSFSTILDQRVRADRAADTQARHFISLNDSDGDLMLSITETGMSERAFARLDLDGDSLLSRQELAKAYSTNE